MVKIRKIIKNLIFFVLGILSSGIFAFFFMTVFANSSNTVEVPYLIGEDKKVAVASLEELKLIPNVVGNGEKVLYTDPEPGTKVKEGHHVIVQMREMNTLKIPDLIGIPSGVARQFLSEYNIAFEIRSQLTYKSEENDVVLNMSPTPGNNYSGEKVILYIGEYEGSNQ
ncbi:MULTISPECIES: PASTA domain-containing protein [Petrotoga]|nr:MULTISPECIES: PASTA domain-containing protein [Petrotoga]POZ87777.1 hypothetical protein AA80_09430 [Petrotoga sibirica DSM 13575]RMA71333.1 PASTA domain-containing protein [Petrotoga olearia]TDX10918.1 PASTA domain-containing protein [Petrotoga sibirica]